MSQGSKALKGNSRSLSNAVLKKRNQVKPGNRVVKPKKAVIVRAAQTQNRLRRDHLERTEMVTAAKIARPSGSTGLKFIGNSFVAPSKK